MTPPPPPPLNAHVGAPRPLPVLVDELVEEILIRLPPDEPEHLARAALVCKPWCRLVAGSAFRCKFRGFHRRVPLLGFVCNTSTGDDSLGSDSVEHPLAAARFVPTTTSSSALRLPRANLPGWRVVDARQGRVLLHGVPWRRSRQFVVLDPVTKSQRVLPEMEISLFPYRWNAAVLCAGAGGLCDHLDCNRDPFVVVYVAINPYGNFAMVYSSEFESDWWMEAGWSSDTKLDSDSQQPHDLLVPEPSILVGDALYVLFPMNAKILKYSLGTRKMGLIHVPPACFSERRVVLMAEEGGGLGLATMRQSKLCLWSKDAASFSGKDAGWEQTRVVDLQPLLPTATFSTPPYVVGFADDGTGIIFVHMDDGLFTIDLKSNQVKEVCKAKVRGDCIIFPYMSFHMPALKASITGEGPRLGVSSAKKT